MSSPIKSLPSMDTSVVSSTTNTTAADGWVEIAADNGAHYRAIVVDVIDGPPASVGLQSVAVKECPQLTLRFENNWHQMETFPIHRIRLPPHQRPIGGSTLDDFIEGQDVEVLAVGQEGEHYGYWRATIKAIKGDFYVVSYATDTAIQMSKSIGQPNGMSDIVTKDKIRPLNTNPYLKWCPYFKIVLEVPKDLVELNPQMMAKSETHDHFRRALSLISVTFVEPMNILVCIGYMAIQLDSWLLLTRRRASVLAEIHYRCLQQWFELKAKVFELRQQRVNVMNEDVIKHNDNGYEMFVKVDQHLIGLAIGGKGANMKRVLSVPGVVSVNHTDGVFHVIATRQEACLTAKRMLQIMEKRVEVPRDIVGHVIGRGGQYAQELTDKSGLISCKIDRTDTTKPSVAFKLIGTADAVDNASLILQFQMNCIGDNIQFEKSVATD